jgi:tripartite-type tricarboxylate transporter receptor subunit TctC
MYRNTAFAMMMMAAGGAANAQTEEYPTRAITLIVAHAAGGATDTVSRLVAESMTKTLGQPVVVENVGGAGSTLGSARAARAQPDGYTLLINHVAQATSGALYPKLAYDPDKSFDGIGLITNVPMTIVSRNDLEPADVSGLLDYIRENKDGVLYGHAGTGSATHLCMMLLMDALDTQMTSVPYKGGAPAMTDLLGGRIDLLCDQTTNTVPQIKAGAIKGFAVTTPDRVAPLPDLPTLQEAGLAGFSMSVWHGLYAPAGTPPEIVEELSAALQVALADTSIAERFADLGTAPVSAEEATPKALDAYLAAEVARWTPIIHEAGVYAE